MLSAISSGINSYICTENANAQQAQRKAACEKPDFVTTMYTTQELKYMLDQELEEKQKEGLKEGLFCSIYNWADWFNQHHPDLAGKSCFCVDGRWVTPEELQKIWIKEFEEERRKSEVCKNSY